MTQKRIEELFDDYQKSLLRLKEVLSAKVDKKHIVVDAAIQRFEFVFELAWKVLKAMLDYYGVDARAPRSALKEAFQNGIIKEGDAWIAMLEDRNLTSHTYDESKAKAIFKKIKSAHVKLLEDLQQEVQSRITKIKEDKE